jgi:hypothetical protein
MPERVTIVHVSAYQSGKRRFFKKNSLPNFCTHFLSSQPVHTSDSSQIRINRCEHQRQMHEQVAGSGGLM